MKNMALLCKIQLMCDQLLTLYMCCYDLTRLELWEAIQLSAFVINSMGQFQPDFTMAITLAGSSKLEAKHWTINTGILFEMH